MGYLLDYSQSFNVYGAFTNVKQYGAQGNGTTDDTNAIQSALNSGGTIYFPPGTYLISSGLTATDVNIVGAGSNTTTIKANITSGTALSLVNTSNATIQNIAIQGTNTAYDTSNTSVGLLIQGDSSTASLMTSAYNITISDFGTSLELGSYTWLNKFYNCSFSASNLGINFAGGTTDGEADSFYGCVISDNTNGAEITEGYYDLYFYGTSFDYNTNYAFNNNGQNTQAINFIGCHFEMDAPTSAIAPIQITNTGSSTNAPWAIIGGQFAPAGTWSDTNAFVYSNTEGAITNLNLGYNGSNDMNAMLYNGTDYYALRGTNTVSGLCNIPYMQGNMAYNSVTPSSSPFTFESNSYNGWSKQQVLIVGGVITEITLNGTSLNTSTSSLILTPNDTIVITYTSAPTLYYMSI